MTVEHRENSRLSTRLNIIDRAVVKYRRWKEGKGYTPHNSAIFDHHEVRWSEFEGEDDLRERLEKVLAGEDGHQG